MYSRWDAYLYQHLGIMFLSKRIPFQETFLTLIGRSQASALSSSLFMVDASCEDPACCLSTEKFLWAFYLHAQLNQLTKELNELRSCFGHILIQAQSCLHSSRQAHQAKQYQDLLSDHQALAFLDKHLLRLLLEYNQE